MPPFVDNSRPFQASWGWNGVTSGSLSFPIGCLVWHGKIFISISPNRIARNNLKGTNEKTGISK